MEKLRGTVMNKQQLHMQISKKHENTHIPVTPVKGNVAIVTSK